MPPAAPRLIIVVEDSLECAETLQIALESLRGMEVRVVVNGEAALEFIRRNQPEIAAVITDLQMPRMSGMDLLARLKSAPELRHIPVLVISGDSDPRLPARSLASGAHAFFPKPYSPFAVRHTREQLLQ
jgi:two-component system chemotaxis response regulator CheY